MNGLASSPARPITVQIRYRSEGRVSYWLMLGGLVRDTHRPYDLSAEDFDALVANGRFAVTNTEAR